MISNDRELATARERVARLERLLENLRKTARPEEWPSLSSGYRLEIERMQGEVLDYLVREEPAPKSAIARQIRATYNGKVIRDKKKAKTSR